MKNNLLDQLAKPYTTDNYLSLVFNPYGKITIDLLKKYCMGAVFTFFKNPIYIESPIVQDNLTISKETIKLTDKDSLRHTFHHFYFKSLKDKDISSESFPLEYIEQGILFRDESNKKLQPYSRQSAFTVTNLHAFCVDKKQCLEEIKSVFKCIRSFEKDWNVTFEVKCHVKDETLVSASEIEKIWKGKFEKNYESEEEAVIALDFNLTLANGEEIELTALEIYSVMIGNKQSILVDFTIGGAERILSTIYSKNNSLPFWLSPIQVIALSKDLEKINMSKLHKDIRLMAVENEEQLTRYKEKFQIPEVYNSQMSWKDFVSNLQAKIPKVINTPLYKNIVLKSSQMNVYDIL